MANAKFTFYHKMERNCFFKGILKLYNKTFICLNSACISIELIPKKGTNPVTKVTGFLFMEAV